MDYRTRLRNIREDRDNIIFILKRRTTSNYICTDSSLRSE